MGPGCADAYHAPSTRAPKEQSNVIVRIGVTYTAKEIEIDLQEDADADEVVKQIEGALADDSQVLWLTDRRGRRVGVPSAKVAYVEIGVQEDRRVGFGVS